MTARGSRHFWNTAHHLGDLDSPAQSCIGKSSPEVLFYFSDKFPRLLMHVYCVIGETRNRELEVWEELDLRNFYISFATAVPTQPQEQQEEDIEDPKEVNWFLWITGPCVVVSWILNALSLMGFWELKEGPIITAFFYLSCCGDLTDVYGKVKPPKPKRQSLLVDVLGTWNSVINEVDMIYYIYRINIETRSFPD